MIGGMRAAKTMWKGDMFKVTEYETLAGVLCFAVRSKRATFRSAPLSIHDQFEDAVANACKREEAVKSI